MITLKENFAQWLEQLGLGNEGITLIQQASIIAIIVVLACITDFICRRIIVPSIKTIVSKTQVTWDDYLLIDRVLDNMCHIIHAIVAYQLLPISFPDTSAQSPFSIYGVFCFLFWSPLKPILFIHVYSSLCIESHLPEAGYFSKVSKQLYSMDPRADEEYKITQMF